MKMNDKNKKLFIIVAMVLMVSLVVGMGAMTYSRYISSHQVPSQNATAAKWGFVVTANTSNLFGSQYKANTGTQATVDGSGNVVAKASAGATDEILAPGTSGYLTISISGQAEVKAQLSVAIDLTKNVGDGADYLPIEWTLVEGNNAPAGDATWVKDPETLSSTNVIEAGTTANNNYRLYWRWVFSSGAANDLKDTVIGGKSAGLTLDQVNAITGLSLTTEQYAAYTTQLEFSATVSIVQLES